MTGTTWTGFRKYWMGTVLAGLGLIAWASVAVAQTMSAGSISAAGGTSAVVPISITVPGGTTVADLSVTISAVPQGGAPAVTDKLTFQVQAPLSNPDLTDNTSVPGSIAIGWVNDELALTGTTQIGTATIPIPGAATEGTYQVTLTHIGVLDNSGNDISTSFTGTPGTITVTAGGPTATPTEAPSATPTIPPIVTPTPTKAATATFTATVTPKVGTATPTTGGGGVCPTCEDDDGCQIGAIGHGAAWLLLIPAIGLLVMRRRSR